MVEALRPDEMLLNNMWVQQAVLNQAQAREPMFEPAQVMPPPGLDGYAPPPGLELPRRKISMDSILEASTHISDDVGTQIRDDGSRVSFSSAHSASQCDTNCLGSISECKFLINDLHNFGATLLSRLNNASQTFQPVDEELAVATGQICVIVKELISEAEQVALELSFASQNEVLHLKLYGSIKQDLALDAVEKLAKLRNRTRKVRSDYLWIIDRLRYLSKCAEAVWDDSLDRGQASCISDLLELGMNHIESSTDFLEDCSDFWIMLHKAELQLPDLKEDKHRDRKFKKATALPEHRRA